MARDIASVADAGRAEGGILTRTWAVCLLATLCCALWGSAFPCIKIGCALLGVASSDVPSELLFAGLRFMLAGAITLVFAGVASGRVPRVRRGSWGMVARLALAQTIVQYAFFYIGVTHTTGVKSSIIDAASTFFSILTAAVLFHQERLTWKKVAGCAVGFAGVVLVNLGGGGLGGGMTLMGEGFVLVSAFSYGLSSALMRNYAQLDDPVALSGYQFVVGGAVLALAGAALGGGFARVTPEGVGMLVYLAFVSGIAYSVWSVLLKHNPTSRVVIFGFMNPVFGVVLSSALLDEGAALPVGLVVPALLLVVAGIVLVNGTPGGASRAE